MKDVKQAAADGSAPLRQASASAAAPASAQPARHGADHAQAGVAGTSRTALSASGKPMRTRAPGVVASGQPEQLRGVRRNMARVMADAHAKEIGRAHV